jgi:ferredoxin
VQIRSVKLVYFSPTRTTESILRSIAGGIGAEPSETIDFTLTEARSHPSKAFQDELVLLGVPVYGGRVPLDAVEYLNRLKASQTPAVLVVVYGNRAYDDARLELSDITVRSGFVPIAAGAFIGEHSFSTPDAPLAPGRPDERDAADARAFGTLIRARLDQLDSIEQATPVSVPGDFPYRERRELRELAPVTSAELCTQCGECAPLCPKDAIGEDDATQTDGNRCILCCACIRACPEDARSVEDPALEEVLTRLRKTCAERRDPETFL